MLRGWPLLVIAACSTATPPPSPPGSQGAPGFEALRGDLAITDVTVVTMTSDAELPHHTVVIRGDRIAAVGPRDRIATPPGVHVISGTGKWLMPGLADMHVHTWREADLAMFLAAGVTTIRNMWGTSRQIAWRDQIARGAQLGPTIITAGDLIDGPSPDWPGSLVLDRPGDADALVAAQQAKGYDFLKSVARLSPAAYQALAAAAARHGMPLAGHVPIAVGLDGVLAAHQRSIEHLAGYLSALAATTQPDLEDPQHLDAVLDRLDPARVDPARVDPARVDPARHPARLPALIQRTIAAGTWNCPTLSVWDPALQDVDRLQARTRWLAYVPAARRAYWKQLYAGEPPTDHDRQTAARAYTEVARVFAALAAGGAPFLVGTDTGVPFIVPGEALHDELERLIAAGVSRPTVLRAATAGAWRYLGKPTEAGVITPGARADLLLISSDPFAVALPLIPDAVVVRGRWLSRAALTAMLDDVARRDTPPSAWPFPPTLAVAGVEVAAVQYDTTAGGAPLTSEQLAAGAGHALAGQLVAPGSDVVVDYLREDRRLRLDVVYHTTMQLHVTASISGGRVCVTGSDLSGAPVALEAPAPAGALVSAPGLAAMRALLDRIIDLPPRGRRTIDAIELAYFPKLAIVPLRLAVERAPDRDGRRVFTITTTRDQATATRELVVDRDGTIDQLVDGDAVTSRHRP